ncbi:MAG: hypothetical protein RIB84_23780 [Sneathiellaceae bacterium]
MTVYRVVGADGAVLGTVRAVSAWSAIGQVAAETGRDAVWLRAEPVAS